MMQNANNREIFGQVSTGPDAGKSIYRIPLCAGGLTANILTWGATLQDLRLEGHDAPLVLGFNSFDSYENHGQYFGATVGRFANRIANGSFEIDGRAYKTDANYMDKHTLHGGSSGYFNRLWTIADQGTSHVYLTLDDPDGSMGFPGSCAATCSYTLKEDGVLQVVYVTRSSAPTPAGLAHHSYFNLDGSGDCRDHTLQILAHAYLPVNLELIPTGEVATLQETPFDFTTPKRIGADLEDAGVYDHNFCLAQNRRGLQDIAVVQSDQSNIQMTISTTEPGLQFYTGHGIKPLDDGLNGATYGPYSGFCLETQNWPDAPNHPDFPDAILRPGDELRQVSEYRFAKLR